MQHSHGMDNLMSHLRTRGSDFERDSLLQRLDQAEQQLESDDRWEARVTDLMADAIQEVREAVLTGSDVEAPLAQLRQLYTNGIVAQNLQNDWLARSRGLDMSRLETTVLSDLRKALTALQKGRVELVMKWVDQAEARFLRVAERYENMVVTESEITIQTVLLHRFFMSGIECWLEALAQLSESTPEDLNSAEVMARALEGQRMMVLVAVLGQEMKRQKPFGFRTFG
ncbi:MAG: hypothetical protein KC800_12980 [Candidatus Eremiobacteraeota bacterium]|nr:hypothetical protein [Candidatus Eremiobacteraeota bacterium]